jgi:aspartokinase
MVTISEAVNEIVSRKPFLEEALASGLINLSSLAREIQPEVSEKLNKEAKLGAIIMALKRLKPTINFQINLRVKRVINQLGDIIVRSKLIDYTYKNSDSLVKNQSLLFERISENKEVFYTVTQGVYETTFILSESVEPELKNIFSNEELIYKFNNLSSITIKLPEENTNVFGVYYHILKKLAYQGINILEIISTTHEFTVIVNDDDVDAAFSVLKKLRQEQL